MTEGVYMTEKDIRRLEVFSKVKSKQLTQTLAAKMLNISVRQVQRLYRGFKNDGAKALVSKKRGMVGNRQLKASDKKQVIEIFSKEIYAGFGPTFMCEILAKHHKIKVSKETVRQLMISAGIWKSKFKKGPVIHQQRQRRARAGELVQIDGSPHAWFENRGDRCNLTVFIDDATGQIYCKFAEVESTKAYMETAIEYINKYGKPLSFYSDKHNIFRVNIPNCNRNEQVTQFGRALKELDIDLICANSPQAKGRVERVNQTLQDRLVKELRIRNISSIEEANRFLRETYIDEFNKQFGVLPSSNENAHREIKTSADLSRIFCEKHQRKVSKNLEINFENVIYQVMLDKPFCGLIGAIVNISKKLDGTIEVDFKGKILSVVEFQKQAYVGKELNTKEIDPFFRDKKKHVVPHNHPFNQKGRAEAQMKAYYAA